MRLLRDVGIVNTDCPLQLVKLITNLKNTYSIIYREIALLCLTLAFFELCIKIGYELLDINSAIDTI